MFDGRRNPGAPWQEQVTSFFRSKLEEEEARVGIPSLNDVQTFIEENKIGTHVVKQQKMNCKMQHHPSAEH